MPLSFAFPLVPFLFLLFLPDKKLIDTWALSLSSSMGGGGLLMRYKGGKRTDRGPISYRVKGHRLKVNASKSYPVHLTRPFIVFFNTFHARRGKKENNNHIARVHF